MIRLTCRINSEELIVKTAHTGLSTQHPDGSMSPANNGPWQQPEFPTRTTAHWAITFSKAYDLTNDEKFRNATFAACDYLISEQARPKGVMFACRKGNSKEMTNGLVGQAWVLEALLQIGIKYEREDYLNAAKNNICSFHFNNKLNLWHVNSIDGKKSIVSNTLNQQIFFSSIALKASEIFKDQYILEACTRFYNCLPDLFYFNSDNIASHKVSYRNYTFYKFKPRALLAKMNNYRNKWKKISLGYLSFVLHGLSVGKVLNSGTNFWREPHLKALISLCINAAQKNLYMDTGSADTFHWSYNPTGFEVALALQHFDIRDKYTNENNSDNWIHKQLLNNYDFSKNSMTLNTLDPIILSARFYEITYLKKFNLEINDNA